MQVRGKEEVRGQLCKWQDKDDGNCLEMFHRMCNGSEGRKKEGRSVREGRCRDEGRGCESWKRGVGG